MTLNSFYRRVLEHLQIVDAETPAAAADVQLVAERYPQVYEMLVTEGLVAWAVAGEIPDYALLPLVSLTAAACAREFGQDPSAYLQGSELAMRMLRRQLASRYVPHRQRAEYF
jgi:hypothetical protein